MLISLTAFVLALSSAGVPAALNNGPCLDSPRAVPHTLEGSDRSAEIVRIDKVVSTATMIDGHVIGYVYTRQDGTTFLGQRTDQYMSAADSTAINGFLAAIHLPSSNVTAFPPKTKYGVRTGYQEFLPVKVPAVGLDELRVRVEPCVAWPAGNPLPDPMP